MNIEKSYMNLVTEITDAPETYLWFTLMHISSSCLGKYIVCPLYMRPTSNPWHPNVWIILSGAPGIMRKSTVINLDQYIVSNSFREYYRTKMPKATPDVIEKIIQNIFIETGSPEGLAEHISSTQNDIDIYIMLSHEFGGILRQMTRRDYMEGYAALLSKLWAGEPHKWHGAKKVRYIKSGLFVTAILGMQKPWLYLDNIMFQQGLMRRVFLIYAEPEDKRKWLPPLNLKKSVLMDELLAISKELSERMLELESLSPVKAMLTPGVLDKINQYARKVESELMQDTDSNWSLYAQSLWDHLVRFSICLAAIRKRPIKSPTFGYVLTVDDSDVSEAQRWIELTLPRTRQALSFTEAPRVKAPIQTVEGPVDVIYSIISSNGKKGVSTSELLRKTRILKDELKKYIIQLLEEDKVVAVVHKSGRGRSRLMFYDKKYESFAVLNGQKIGSKTLEAIW